MAGAYPASMACKKNKFIEEWNGQREITHLFRRFRGRAHVTHVRDCHSLWLLYNGSSGIPFRNGSTIQGYLLDDCSMQHQTI